MTCRDLVELVTDYLDGALEPGVHAVVAEHLRGCDGCAEYVGQLRATIAALAAMPSPVLDPMVCARLLAAFRMYSGWRDNN